MPNIGLNPHNHRVYIQVERIKYWIRQILTIALCLLFFLPNTRSSINALENESITKWSTIEIEFAGPVSLGMGEPNPFKIDLTVEFSATGRADWMGIYGKCVSLHLQLVLGHTRPAVQSHYWMA
jgi:hypothetical protein